MKILPVFVTSNPKKAEQLGWHLHMAIDHIAYDVPEIQSLSLDQVVRHKAQAAYALAKRPVLVEDTALTFHALGRLPGPLVKWFFTELQNDGLCKLLKNCTDKSATAEVVFAYFDGTTCKLFNASVEGEIAQEPRGDQSFGWDPIFIPGGQNKTWGEMSKDQQIATSMRRVALHKLERYLRSVD